MPQMRKRPRWRALQTTHLFYITVHHTAILHAAGSAKLVDAVGALPRESGILASKVTVGGSLLEDGATQVEIANDSARAQVEDGSHGTFDSGLVHMGGAKGIDHDRERLGDADRICQLDLAAIGKTGGDHVFGNPARRIGGGTVDLGAVLTRERAAAVPAAAAVGVNDDLTAGKTGVRLRAADNEAAGRVDVEVGVLPVDARPC